MQPCSAPGLPPASSLLPAMLPTSLLPADLLEAIDITSLEAPAPFTPESGVSSSDVPSLAGLASDPFATVSIGNPAACNSQHQADKLADLLMRAKALRKLQQAVAATGLEVGDVVTNGPTQQKQWVLSNDWAPHLEAQLHAPLHSWNTVGLGQSVHTQANSQPTACAAAAAPAREGPSSLDDALRMLGLLTLQQSLNTVGPDFQQVHDLANAHALASSFARQRSAPTACFPGGDVLVPFGHVEEQRKRRNGRRRGGSRAARARRAAAAAAAAAAKNAAPTSPGKDWESQAVATSDASDSSVYLARTRSLTAVDQAGASSGSSHPASPSSPPQKLRPATDPPPAARGRPALRMPRSPTPRCNATSIALQARMPPSPFTDMLPPPFEAPALPPQPHGPARPVPPPPAYPNPARLFARGPSAFPAAQCAGGYGMWDNQSLSPADFHRSVSSPVGHGGPSAHAQGAAARHMALRHMAQGPARAGSGYCFPEHRAPAPVPTTVPRIGTDQFAGLNAPLGALPSPFLMSGFGEGNDAATSAALAVLMDSASSAGAPRAQHSGLGAWGSASLSAQCL